MRTVALCLDRDRRKLRALMLLLGLDHKDAWNVVKTYTAISHREDRADLRISYRDLVRRGAGFDEIRAAVDEQINREGEARTNGGVS